MLLTKRTMAFARIACGLFGDDSFAPWSANPAQGAAQMNALCYSPMMQRFIGEARQRGRDRRECLLIRTCAALQFNVGPVRCILGTLEYSCRTRM
jgi:hypothetical protein